VIAAKMARVLLAFQDGVNSRKARNTVDSRVVRDIRPLILGAAGETARQFRLVGGQHIHHKTRTRLESGNDSAVAAQTPEDQRRIQRYGCERVDGESRRPAVDIERRHDGNAGGEAT
jgi:hypothetical protein